MIAGIVQEAGVLIGAVAALVVALAVAYGFISSKFEKITAQIGEVHVTAEAVNRAVNHVEPGTPSIREQVARMNESLHDHIETTEAWRNDADARLTRIEDHITRPTGARKKAS